MSYSCDRAQENISAYVDGELGVLETVRLKLHTLKCEKCREDLNFEKALVRTMSSENFFMPHNFSESLHRKLEVEYTKSPVKRNENVVFENKAPSRFSIFFTWINEKKAYVAACACLIMFVFAFSSYQLGGNHEVAEKGTNQTEMVYYPKGMARVADMSGITDENVSSQEIAGVNQNVFDKFRNKYMTKKFVDNFSFINDTVVYSTTQNRGITAIMRTIKEVVTDAVSGKNVNSALIPHVSTSITSIAYVQPNTASSKIAVDLREKVPVNVDNESLYGVLMVDKEASDLSPNSNSGVSTASAEYYDLRNNAESKAGYNSENGKLAFAYSNIKDYSAYTPTSLSVKNATFTADREKLSAVKDILYEYRNSIEVKETDSSITITIDGVNYEVLQSRLKMEAVCTFNQMQARDYTMSYSSLVNRQLKLMEEPQKYDELVKVTEEIEELLYKLGKNTITINLK